jgi:protein-S-isoprenylcysteine O-methyltransferase Ste14
MARVEGESARDAAAVRLFPPGVPLGVILAGVGLNRLWPIDPGFIIPAPARYWIGGAIAAGAFLGLGLWAVVLFRRSGQNENPWKPTPSIVERGPFRITRNPMYLQMVLICIGFAIILMNVWILLLTPVGAWMLQHFVIRAEEEYLERKFGEDYLAYKRRVRRWI